MESQVKMVARPEMASSQLNTSVPTAGLTLM